MTPTRIITHNRAALLRVLASLFAMAGLVSGGSVPTLARGLRLSVLRLLRPVESAVRRLMVVEAQGLEVTAPVPRSGARAAKSKRSERARMPSFPLVEPLPRTGPPAPRYVQGPGPRIFFFDGTDPVIETPPPPPSDEDAMDAGGVCRRLLAVQMVLDDLPKYAMRLARWQAARDAAPPRSGRLHPLRRGRPPGFWARGKREVDEILAECHQLALRAINAPDTS